MLALIAVLLMALVLAVQEKIEDKKFAVRGIWNYIFQAVEGGFQVATGAGLLAVLKLLLQGSVLCMTESCDSQRHYLLPILSLTGTLLYLAIAYRLNTVMGKLSRIEFQLHRPFDRSLDTRVSDDDFLQLRVTPLSRKTNRHVQKTLVAKVVMMASTIYAPELSGGVGPIIVAATSVCASLMLIVDAFSEDSFFEPEMPGEPALPWRLSANAVQAGVCAGLVWIYGFQLSISVALDAAQARDNQSFLCRVVFLVLPIAFFLGYTTKRRKAKSAAPKQSLSTPLIPK